MKFGIKKCVFDQKLNYDPKNRSCMKFYDVSQTIVFRGPTEPFKPIWCYHTAKMANFAFFS